MAKLFPPVIEGIVPAFYDNEEGMVEVIIPFSMNRAVSQTQVKGLAVKVKTVQSSSYLYTGRVLEPLNYSILDSCWVRVLIDKIEVPQMRVGQYYKFQLAFIDNSDEIGYYSTVGVGKYTAQPKIEISGLSRGGINSHTYKYIGHYNQKGGDITEIEYSYQFDIYDDKETIIYTTGEQLHNSSNDTELDESYDELIYSSDLPLNASYRIKYTVNTINGMTISTPRYRIMQKMSIDPEIDITIKADLDFDNGYISINTIGNKDDTGVEKTATGAFLLSRACSDDGYTEWNEILRFKLVSQSPTLALWQDFTIEQGKTYKYSIQQYNDGGLYSNRIYSNEVYGDFEDAFLYDGKRQLKIRYNPKVSSFKRDLLETKIETIGSKHPFIFRNGNVDYKEFPISGLISYFMDEEGKFLNPEEFKVNSYTTNPTSENIALERKFKMEAYEWLTNGETKLFRSPTEGNYIVRLMNVSLAPNDTLGRMLHTFSATAYEMAEYGYEALSSFGIVESQESKKTLLRFESVDLSSGTYDSTTKKFIYAYGNGEKINRYPAYMVRLTDMNPGDRVIFSFENGGEQIIQIGITGSYYADLDVPVQGITFDNGTTPKGIATYSYYTTQSVSFGKTSDVSIEEIPGRQFIGEHDIIKDIEYIEINNNGLVEQVKNPKIDLLKIYTLNAQLRLIERITQDANGEYFKDKNYSIPLGEDKDLFTLYALGRWITTNPVGPYGKYTQEFQIEKYIDFSSGTPKEIEVEDYEPCIWINGSEISLEDIKEFSIEDLENITSLTCGNGCMLEITYQVRNIDYYIEDNTKYNVWQFKANYQKDTNELNNLLQGDISNIEDFIQKEAECQEKIKVSYQTYIEALIKAQKEEEEMGGPHGE